MTYKLQHAISVGRKSSDGYIDNTDFTISNVFYSGKLNLNSGNLNYQLGADTKGFGANSFYTPKYPNQYEKTRNFVCFGEMGIKLEMAFHTCNLLRRHQDRFELYREDKYQLVDGVHYVWKNDTIPAWYKNHNYH